MKHIFTISLCFLTLSITICGTQLTDDNIHEAVDLWLSEEALAEATYDHISDWDVSSVTDMEHMFYDASALSRANQCAIHTSFSLNSAWPYNWSEYCD